MPMSAKADPRELLRRFSGNPVLRPHDFPKMVNAVFNPGATVFEGRTLLLLRVEYRTGLSSLVAATSDNGLTDWEIDPVRGLHPVVDSFEEHWGVEDPRITQVGDEYFVVYVGYSAAGPLVLLATTRDFARWERRGVLMSPEDKDAALFPTTFGGRWALIHRPAPSMASPRRAHMAVLQPRSPALGDLPGAAASPTRGVVGRQQGRPRPAAAAHQAGLARLLPRCTSHRVGIDLPARPGPARPRRPHQDAGAGQ